LLKILIVEDEDFERRALKYIINKFFSDELEVVGEASNGEEAVDKCMDLKPDIILMDINMPILDGLQASEKIKEKSADVEIIILTAYNYFEYARKGIKVGVSDYLLKPFSNEEFLTSINKITQRIKDRKTDKAADIDEEQDSELVEEVSSYSNKNNAEIVAAAKKYIQTNYTKEINLDEIANHVAISSFYLSRIFSKSEGMTYKDYLIKLRMEKAKQLLSEGRKSIKEISIEVGYLDQNYFSRAFKKYFHKSPKEFYLKKDM
jgi:two-component system, response regulator YesN